MKLAVSSLLVVVLFVPALASASQGSNESAGEQPAAKAQLPAQTQPAVQSQSAKQSETAKTTAREKPKNADAEVSKSADVQLIEVEKQILEKTNAQRVKYGLPPLTADRHLVQTARSHAAWMTNNRSLQHTSQPVGENIAMGQRTTDEAVNDWMNSSGHRANILSPSYKRTGVAAYQTPDGTIYWCQQFLP